MFFANYLMKFLEVSDYLFTFAAKVVKVPMVTEVNILSKS